MRMHAQHTEVEDDFGGTGEEEIGATPPWLANPVDVNNDNVADVADFAAISQAVINWGE